MHILGVNLGQQGRELRQGMAHSPPPITTTHTHTRVEDALGGSREAGTGRSPSHP